MKSAEEWRDEIDGLDLGEGRNNAGAYRALLALIEDVQCDALEAAADYVDCADEFRIAAAIRKMKP